AVGRLGQHLVVPNQPHEVPPVSRPHRRSLTCRQSSAPTQFARLMHITRVCRPILMPVKITDAEEVTGSNPVSPTILTRGFTQKSGRCAAYMQQQVADLG